MSSPAFQIRSGRIRAAAAGGCRLAGAAVERARLTVVPRARTRTSRAAVRDAGVVRAARRRDRAADVQHLDAAGGVRGHRDGAAGRHPHGPRADAAHGARPLRDPQRVARKAQGMGMVIPATPAFLRLADGKVLGTPAPATRDDALRLLPRAPRSRPSWTRRRTSSRSIADADRHRRRRHGERQRTGRG